MLFMESYLCYCSVRLGVLIVAALAIVSSILFVFLILIFIHNFPQMLSLTLSTLLFVRGVRLFDELIDLLENDSQYKSSNIIRRLINWIEQCEYES